MRPSYPLLGALLTACGPRIVPPPTPTTGAPIATVSLSDPAPATSSSAPTLIVLPTLASMTEVPGDRHGHALVASKEQTFVSDAPAYRAGSAPAGFFACVELEPRVSDRPRTVACARKDGPKAFTFATGPAFGAPATRSGRLGDCLACHAAADDGGVIGP